MGIKKRNNYIDILRGLAVIAVIMGHALQRGMVTGYNQTILWKIIYAWHMPLFMVLSGYTLYLTKSKWNLPYVCNKAIRLLVPTVVWSYIIYFMRNMWFVGITPFIEFPDNILQYTIILIKDPTYLIWFLYVVFMCTLCIIVAEKISKKYADVLIFLSIIFVNIQPSNRLGLYYIKYYIVIFALGYWLCKYQEIILKKYKTVLHATFIVSVIMCVMTYSVEFIPNNIHNYLLAYSSCYIIIIAVIYMEKKIHNAWMSKVKDILIFIGRYSLPIYLTQGICLNIGFGNGVLRIVTIFITATCLSILLSVLIDNTYVLKVILFGDIKIPFIKKKINYNLEN